MPIFTYIGHSNKKSKQICNKRFRLRSKINLKDGKDLPVYLNEIMTEYDFLGDGKCFYRNAPEKDMRK